MPPQEELPQPAKGPFPSRSRRLAPLALLLLVLSTLTGCAYLRFLKFKNQLKEFEANVQVERGAGFRFAFQKPILRQADFTFITESRPTSATIASEQDETELWGYSFYKLDRDGNRSADCRLDFQLRFEDHLLASLSLDPRVLRALPDEVVVSLLRALGTAKINALRRSVRAEFDASDLTHDRAPRLAHILEELGPPTASVTRDDGTVENEYAFAFFNPETGEIGGLFRTFFISSSDDPSQRIVRFALSAKGQ